MNNEQIKETIDNLKDLRRVNTSFIIPLFTGIIVAVAKQDFLSNNLFRLLIIIAGILIIFICFNISRINKKIVSLINQLI
jgi:hypothetical protein